MWSKQLYLQKKHIKLNYLKQPDISERFINTTLEKSENFDPKCTNFVINDRLISDINSATEETLPCEKKLDYISCGIMIY